MSLYVLSELRLAQSKLYLIWQFFRVTSGGARVGGVIKSILGLTGS